MAAATPVPVPKLIPTAPILEQMTVLLAKGVPATDPQMLALMTQYNEALKTG
jgi:hypothetical protein